MEDMQQLEADMRKRLIFAMGMLVISCSAVDIAFFLFYYFGNMLDTTVPIYVFKRLVLPFIISFISYMVARKYNASYHSDESKNMVCAICLETIAGAMSMCHSFFTPIWCAPASTMIVGMAFHNKKLSRILLIYGYILIVLSALWITIEHPEDMSYYFQTLFVVIVMHSLFYMVGNVVQSHNLCVVDCTKQMYMKQQSYREQLQYDALTGVFSRRYLMERANEHISRCSEDNPVSVAIIDIDNFKSVNDTYGHENGDVVLRRLGLLLLPEISEHVTVGRFGGEEFVMVYEGKDTKIYRHSLEKLREKFSEERFEFMDKNVTFSGGFITCRRSCEFDDVLELADQGLYKSKKSGKNMITDAILP